MASAPKGANLIRFPPFALDVPNARLYRDDEIIPLRGKTLAVLEYLVARPGSDLSEDRLRTWSKGQLAPFQVPHRVVFHDDLPRNETGKVLKRNLVAPEC